MRKNTRNIRTKSDALKEEEEQLQIIHLQREKGLLVSAIYNIDSAIKYLKKHDSLYPSKITLTK